MSDSDGPGSHRTSLESNQDPKAYLLPQTSASPESLDYVEAQSDSAAKDAAVPLGLEYNTSTTVKALSLGCWFLLNLSLTFYNKAILEKFHLPWLLTCLHCSCVSIGCYALLVSGVFELTKLSLTESWILAAFSCLYTLNISLSNVSLALVSVPFHQTVRATSPVWTILLQRAWFGRRYSMRTYTANLIIVLGVAMVTFGEYSFTLLGFTLTLLGVVLASFKGVATNRLLTGSLSLLPLELLLRLSPLAALQALGYAYMGGECDQLPDVWTAAAASRRTMVGWGIALLGNGTAAFALNYFSFEANRRAGPLTLSIAGNLKQCFTILLGVVLFRVQVGWLNGIGMIVALSGAWWYSCIEFTTMNPAEH